MIVYEDQRTKQIVDRLVAMADTLRAFTVPIWAMLGGVLFAILVALLDNSLWWLGGLLGLVIGAALGTLAASYLSILLEWMAQLLIAQGEIIARLRQ